MLRAYKYHLLSYVYVWNGIWNSCNGFVTDRIQNKLLVVYNNEKPYISESKTPEVGILQMILQSPTMKTVNAYKRSPINQVAKACL